MFGVRAKIKYLATHKWYHPYFGYWWDLFTERHLKSRKGECVDCINCCKHWGYICPHANLKTKRCDIYDNRTCLIWFPISKKELDYFYKIKGKGFKCKYTWDKDKK